MVDKIDKQSKKTRGGARPGSGRPPGTPNKATRNAREAIAAFIDGNAEKLNRWLDEIEANEGPKAAFQCFQSVLEHHVPKLARTEVSGPDGGPQEHSVTLNINGVKPNA